MAKKKAAKKQATKTEQVPAKVSREVRNAGPVQTSDLVDTNQAVKLVNEAEQNWRLRVLKENEELARSTVDMEVDIRRLLGEQSKLRGNHQSLTKEQAKVAESVKQLSEQVNSLEKQRDLTVARNNNLKDEIDDLEKAINVLETQNNALEKEDKKLQTQQKKLDEDVARLRKLREDYMSTIAKFKEEKDDLLS